jgi:beta-glucosidase
LSNLRVGPAVVKPDGMANVTVDVKNTGGRQGDEVVQIYVNDVIASVERPVLQLKGFRRVSLDSSETVTVEFDLPLKELAFYGIDMKLKVEPGLYNVMVGNSSRNLTLQGQFEVQE